MTIYLRSLWKTLKKLPAILFWIIGYLISVVIIIYVLKSAIPESDSGLIAVIMTTAFTYITTRLKELEEAHRQAKIDMYQKFVENIISVFFEAGGERNSKSGTKSIRNVANDTEKWKKEFFATFMLRASPEVVMAFNNIKTGDGRDVTRDFTVLVKVMREDIGLHGLNEEEIGSLLLKVAASSIKSKQGSAQT